MRRKASRRQYEPAIARRRACFMISQRCGQRSQPVLLRAGIGVDKSEYFTVAMRKLNRMSQVVNLLSTMLRFTGNHNLHCGANLALKRSAGFVDDCERLVVSSISYKDDFETRIVLAKDRRDIFA